jgi:hypothetical protein
VIIEEPGGVGVIAGQTHHRFRVFVRANFRNSDAFGVDDGGQVSTPRCETAILAGIAAFFEAIKWTGGSLI